MTLGLGTGSAAAHALDRLADLVRAGALPGVADVPTSLQTELHATGIPLLADSMLPTSSRDSLPSPVSRQREAPPVGAEAAPPCGHPPVGVAGNWPCSCRR
jgi:ribose 5-phosphate isomerase A